MALHTWLAKARALVTRRRLDRDLDDEIRTHIDLLAAEHVRRGLTTEEARDAARREFGGVEPMKEAHRDARGARVLEHLWRDMLFACRALRKSPGFAVAVVLTLALGIGANTAIFTLLNAVSWQNLPVRDPESLLLVTRLRLGRVETGFTYPQSRALRDQVSGARLAAYSSSAFPLLLAATSRNGLEPPITGQLVSGTFFDLLGIFPQRGRLIGVEDDRVPNGHPVVVMSDGYWRRRFARDEGIVGKTLMLSDTRFDIIGITPPEFFGVEVGLAPDVFMPIMMQAAVMPVVGDLIVKPNVNRTWLQLLARLDRGARGETVAAMLEPVYRRQLPDLPASLRARSGYEDKIILAPAARGLSDLRAQFSTSLFILLGVVAAVLLIGCANTANLLLARAAARRSELALRLALGSSRGRLMQQVLVEGVVLGTFGALGGVVIAAMLTRLLIAYASLGRTPVAIALTEDVRVLTFTLVVSLACTLLFVVVPAARVSRIDLLAAMKSVDRAATGFSGLRPGRLLVVVQVSLSLMLLVAAGLFVRTLINLTTADRIASRERVLVVRVEPHGSNQRGTPGMSDRLDRMYTDLIARVGALPGVRSVSMSNVSPGKPESGAGMAITPTGGVRVEEASSRPIASGQAIYPHYFDTVGIGLRGRDFEPADVRQEAAPVCIVNESFVRIAYPNDDPIGKTCVTIGVPRRAYSIVGVVDDSRYTNPRAPVQPVVYTPFLHANTGRGQMILYVRTDGDPGSLVARVREEVWKTDRTVPQYEVRTLAEEVDSVVMKERLLATVSSSFAVMALLLTAIGLHGLLSFLVVQRIRELAIRFALGAQRAGVMALVVREAVVLVGGGALIAIPLAIAAGRLSSRWLSEVLFELTPTDAASFAAAAAVLVVVGACAAALPTRRASRIDPMVALKE
jgi:predicted permease